MWFNPAEIAKTETPPPATFAIPATFEAKTGEESQKSQKSQPVDSPKALIDSCRYCAHQRQPGIENRHCIGRDDLPPAYCPENPLRILPDDLGDSCQSFVLAEAYR